MRKVKSSTGPSEVVAEKISDEVFIKSKNYKLELGKFCFFEEVFSCVLFIISILSFFKLWNFCPNILIFTFISSVIHFLISLPFSYYKNFVIDEKYGFNKSTIKLWVSDKLKEFGLSYCLSLILMFVFVLLYKYLKNWFFISGVVFIFIITVFIQILFPIFILPLFIKLTPIENADVLNVLDNLISKCNLKNYSFFQADTSKRTTKQNAFTYGIFESTVCLSDTVIQKCDPDDIAAITAHEVGHVSHHHVWKLLFLNQINSFIILSLFLYVMTSSVLLDFGFIEKNIAIGFILSNMILEPMETLISLPMNLIIRSFEYQADAYSVSYGYNLEKALVKIVEENFEVIEPDPIAAAIKSTHPSLSERIIAIRNLQNKIK